MAGNRPTLVRGMALRAALAAATAVGAGGVLSAAWPGTASADVPVSAVAWWTQSPSPATVPDGGISVATAPSGAISVAAVKVDTGGGASSATLTLNEDSGQGQQAAALQACATTNDWKTESGGPWADAPPADCRPESTVPLTRDANGQWTGDISKLLSSKTGEQSVMVVPTPAAAGLGNVPFQIAFKPPTVAGTVASPSDTSSSSSSSTETATSPSYSSSPSSGSSSTAAAPSFVAGATSASPTYSDTQTSPAAAAPSSAQAAPSSSPAASTDHSAPAAGSGQFKVHLGASAGSSGHHTTRGSAIGVFALALFIGAIAAAGSWAKAQGFFDITRLQRFSR